MKLKNKVFDLRKFVLNDDIEKAQLNYASLIVFLCEASSVIEENIRQDIQNLSDEILNNVSKSMFLKRVYLKNTRKVLKHLDDLEEKLQSKCADIERYFNLVKV